MKVIRRFYARKASILADERFPKATILEAITDAKIRAMESGEDQVVVQIVRVIRRVKPMPPPFVVETVR